MNGCVYVCVNVCMCVYVYMFVCIYVCVCIYVRISIHVYACLCTYMYENKYGLLSVTLYSVNRLQGCDANLYGK